MKTIRIVSKLVSLFLVVVPLSAYASYYVVYDVPEMGCGTCNVYHRHTVRAVPHHHTYKHKHHYVKQRKPSSYSITVYYPLPAYAWAPPPCGCCAEPVVRKYYSQPSYSGSNVYFMKPEDRLVGNRYDGDDYYGPSVDTGTADNDTY